MTIQVSRYFTPNELNQLAKECGFHKRCSGKIDGNLFLNLIVYHKECLKHQSLDQLCISLNQQYGIDITKQSLHERFNNYAVSFLKNALEKVMSKHLNKDRILKKINGFTRILIKDSTCFQVNENLQEQFPGCGGASSKASVRIQFEFNILSGEIVSLSLNPFTTQDSTDSITTIENVNPGELIIRDLAYMRINTLQGIITRLAFFCSRLSPNYNVYEMKAGKQVQIDFKKIRSYMIKNKLTLIEKKVFITLKKPIEVRLIINLLPDAVVAERMRHLKIKQRRKGRRLMPLAERYTARCFFNLFITNASDEQISKEALCELYKFRWQIELLFKVWKSIWKIHEIKKVNVFRFQCYIYARLLIITMSWNIIWNLIHATIETGNVIPSIDKCNKFILHSLEKMRDLLSGNLNNLKFYIRFLCSRINYLLLERHGKRKSQFEQILLWDKECTA